MKRFGFLLALAAPFASGSPSRAASVPEARLAAKNDPRNANAQYDLGLAIMQEIEGPLRRGRLDPEQAAMAKEAEAAYERALKLADHHGRAHIMLGMLLNMTRQSAAAVPHLRKGMALPPDSDDWLIAATTLVDAYFNQQQPAPAEPILREILRHYPKDAKAWHRLGLVYEMTGRGALAAEPQKKAIALGYGSQAREALARVQRGGGKTRRTGATEDRDEAPSRENDRKDPNQRVSVPANSGNLVRSQLAYAESADAVTGKVYAYVAYSEKDSSTGDFKVIVNGNRTSGASYDPAQGVFKRKIAEAQANGLSYFTHGFRMKPSAADARLFESRVWFDSSGRPTGLELALVTRNADGSARPSVNTKVPWPHR